MKKARLFLLITALTLVSTGIWAWKSRQLSGALYMYCGTTYSQVTSSSSTIFYFKTSGTCLATICCCGTNCCQLYLYSAGVYKQLYCN